MSTNLPPLLPQTGEARLPAHSTEWLNVIHAIAVEAMTAQSDPHAEAQVYRKALIGICNMALKAQDALKLSAGSSQAPETPPKVRVGDEDIDALTFASRCMNDVAATLDRLVDSNNSGGSWESAGHLRNRVNGSLRSLARGLSTNAERIALAASSSDEQAEGQR